METLINQIVAEWNAETVPDRKWTDTVIARVAAFPYKPSTIDPDHLGSRAVALTHIKNACIATDIHADEYDGEMKVVIRQYGTTSPEYKQFVSSTLAQKYQLQKQWRKQGATGVAAALANVTAVPPELHALRLPAADKKHLDTIRAARLKQKAGKVTEFNGDVLLRDIMPHLASTDIKQCVPALLLATGRRVIEVLKTGVFKPLGEYRCSFAGQAKRGANPDVTYSIDLLAPAKEVVAAVERLRKQHDMSDTKNDDVHRAWNMPINRAVRKLAHTNPHMLRSINAVACEQLYNTGKAAKSFMGYIGDHLGHHDVGNAIHYQSVKVTITSPWIAAAAQQREETKAAEATAERKVAAPVDVEDGAVAKQEAKAKPKRAAVANTHKQHEEADPAEFGLTYKTGPEQRKAREIAALMKARQTHLNAHTIKQAVGGSSAMLNKLLSYDMNARVIEAYNASLR